MLIPLIVDDRADSLSRVPSQFGHAAKHRGALDEGLDVRLQRVDVLAEHRLADLGDQALVGDVDLLDLDLAGLAVEQVVALALGEVLDRHVGRHDHLVRRHHPPVRGVAGHQDRALDERLRLVDDRRQVEVGDGAAALALGAHAAEVDRLADDVLLHLPAGLLGGHDAARLAGRHVERRTPSAARCTASPAG